MVWGGLGWLWVVSGDLGWFGVYICFIPALSVALKGSYSTSKGGAMDPHTPAVPPDPPRRFPQIPLDSQNSPIFNIF